MKKQPQKRIRKATPQRAKAQRQYSRARVAWLEHHRFCEFPNCLQRSTEVHHSRGRMGGLLLAEEYWIPLCAFHHDWAHRNIGRAREIGLIAPLGKWNTTK